VSLTDVLAVVGAVTGVSGAVLGVASYRRDRSRLLVRHSDVGTPTKDGHVRYVRIYVINAGRQPVAILEAGLSEARRSWRDRLSRGLDHARLLLRPRGFTSSAGTQLWSALEDSDDPAVLEPGDLKKFILIETKEPRLSDAQAPVYAFATDALDRTSWSPSPVLSETASWMRSESEPQSDFG
jgi:hypothetical protein